MTRVEELAAFVTRTSYEGVSDSARTQLKIRVLDSIGCAVGAIGAEVMQALRRHVEQFDGGTASSLIGGGRAAPDRAALYNGALVRYLDFNDSYLAKGETCHPSDNLGALLAAAEHANGSGRNLLAALAVAYQVQCRLSDVAPVRLAGFDHTTQGAYAVAAGVSKALGLDQAQTANAIAIAGTALNALRVTRTGRLSHWKGLAYPFSAAAALSAGFLAKAGITGPLEVFEGEKGFMDSIAGPFEIDWSQEDLEIVTRTILKKHNAEIHSQTAIECALQLRQQESFDVDEIERLELDTFDVAFHIIGGGDEGDKTIVRTKEEADHSLPYLTSVALLDRQVMPEQYEPERINRQDVQALLRKVSIRPTEPFSARFPREMPARLTITLRNGHVLSKEHFDYPGFTTQPPTWATTLEKFERLANPVADVSLRRAIAEAVKNLESIHVHELMQLLEKVPQTRIPVRYRTKEA
jgi:2-methylcitrate dehydratase